MYVCSYYNTHFSLLVSHANTGFLEKKNILLLARQTFANRCFEILDINKAKKYLLPPFSPDMCMCSVSGATSTFVPYTLNNRLSDFEEAECVKVAMSD